MQRLVYQAPQQCWGGERGLLQLAGRGSTGVILQQGLAKGLVLGQFGMQLCSRQIMALCVGVRRGRGGYLILVGQLEKKQASRMQLTG